MTRIETKELLSAIIHFANGGELWWYNPSSDTWKKQIKVWCNKADMHNDRIMNVIEDSHFESRKHFALGGEIEYQNPDTALWQLVEGSIPLFDDWITYRPKPKEPVYEWQWYYFETMRDHSCFRLTYHWHTTKEKAQLQTGHYEIQGKFEPSKRIRDERT